MNLDDPKLTAYALGEITDPAEITEVETWLAANAEGRASVDDTREMAAFLSEKLHTTTAVELTREQKAAILTPEKVVQFPAKNRSWSMIGLAALAACLAAAPLLPWTELLRLRDSAPPTLAINDKPMTLQMPVGELKKEAAGEDDQIEPEPLGSNRLSESETLPLEISAAVSPESTPLAEDTTSTRLPYADGPSAVPQRRENLKNEVFGNFQASSSSQDAAAAQPSLQKQLPLTASAGAPQSTTLSGEVSRTLRGSGFAGGGKAKLAPRDRFADDSRKVSRLGIDKDATPADGTPNTEAYDSITENDFLAARDNPLSTFSIDVDTASYANVRRFLNNGQLPPKGAVRIEEMLNYFTYDYAKPEGDAPFSTNLEVATCPWQPDHRLVRIGLRGREIPVAERKPANLVFLIDVSGSMDETNKLPLLKQSLRLLVDQLGENDRVALAVYAGSSGLVLPSTSDKQAIRDALENLQPGGSTNGASGIQLAYEQAVAHFQKDGVNRVILATDGDFNVGVTNQSDLVDLITEKAKSGVFLSVLGFGTGNVKDSTMEKLADKGNGNYAYIDSLKEGKKVLVEQMGGTLVTIAKDVKIQVEFNPAVVSNYRLIGYENRALKKEDFADDKKDAGEIGAGHTVTVLYEVVMVGSMSKEVKAERLKYTQNNQVATLPSGEMLTVKLRYKEPAGDTSKLLEFPLTDSGKKLDTASKDFQFASAVVEFGQLLRQSDHNGLASWESLIARAADAKGEDKGGYRAEFIELAKKAQALTRRNDS